MADPCFPSVPAPYQMSYFSACVSFLLAIAISLGNFIIIITVIRDPERKLRTPFAFFLANLAISDFIVGAIAMPISVVFHTLEAQGTISRAMTLILHLSYFISASASLFSMGAMCIDRHLALVNMSIKGRNITTTRCIVIASCIWIFAGAISGFYFILGYVTFLMMYIHIALVTSLCINLLTYVSLLRNLKNIRKTLARNQTRAEKKKSKRVLQEKKLTKVFMTMIFVFLSTYVPCFIFIYILQFCLSCGCDARHILRDFVYLLVSASSATNPVVCILRLPVIRKAVMNAVRCKKRTRYAFTSTISFDKNEHYIKINSPCNTQSNTPELAKSDTFCTEVKLTDTPRVIHRMGNDNKAFAKNE